MDISLPQLADYLPADIELLPMLKFLAFLSAAVLIIGFLIKLILGEKSELNHALSSTLSILAIYAVTVVVDAFDPYGMQRFLTPLPFVSFADSKLLLLPITTTPMPELAAHLLSMMILAFLVNLLDTIVPTGETLLGWCVLRIISVMLAMATHYAAVWALQTYLPGILVSYATVILLALLGVVLFLGLLKLLLGLVIGAIDPIIGAISAFFFSHIVGKQLAKAAFTTAILCTLVYLLDRFGYTVICVSTAALSAYIPLALVLLALWFIIGYLL